MNIDIQEELEKRKLQIREEEAAEEEKMRKYEEE
jgi:hypothetical protein